MSAPKNATLRVIVVDDEELVRASFAAILSSAPDIEVVAACNGTVAVAAVSAHLPDVVLLDVRMPGVSGLDILRHIRKLPEPPEVMMLTSFSPGGAVRDALRDGAAGYLLKNTAPEQVIRGVRVLAAGGFMLSRSIAARVVEGYVSSVSPEAELEKLKALTPRERQALVLLGHGKSNEEIAEAMQIALGTAKDHIVALMGKLGVNRVRAAVLAERAGLL
ncbi:DNA-binding response regulator [Streptomyces sp. WAC 01529]|uniref:response regulator n=1 Tax=Streptomyces sp. WAC 01529 TaxID=2203205 RepID=UPI000F6D48DC|nr:response regulator transcription factor [Streptomyces sp. WAC 01529]AZM54127.1 DNA-binding response regulator [Streptomyces sp. WAC 01529]